MSVLSILEKAIEPIGERMEDWRIWAAPAKKMGYGEYFPWKEAYDLFEYLLEPTGVTVDKLKENQGSVTYGKLKDQQISQERIFDRHLERSSCIQKSCEGMAMIDCRHFMNPLRALSADQYLAKKYPLTLITGVRVDEYNHSRYRNIPSMRNLMPEPFIEINPQTAKYSRHLRPGHGYR